MTMTQDQLLRTAMAMTTTLSRMKTTMTQDQLLRTAMAMTTTQMRVIK